MIVWDLFSNCIEAAKVLNVDKKFAEKLAGLRARLQPLTIGEYGQLQEWRNPKLNKGANKDHHRHVSHMYAVYPGKQIIIGRDEVLAKAARQAMIYRGDNATGWSMGWKVNLWARFLDGDHAHKMIVNLISGKLFDNMWDAHPPFQIDGNFGVTAGIAEMLIQSHAGEIRLLPALPKVWSTGSVKGLRARGGYTVDIAWKDGKLTSVTVTADKKGSVRLAYGDKTISVPIKSGKTITRDGLLK
jgi:alpha-L-fucosidase 2